MYKLQIDITVDGEKKTFVTSEVTMKARRKFMEIRAKEEEILEKQATIPTKKQIEFENEMINILVDVVFGNQFTADELIDGVSDDYFDEKLAEAIFGKIENEEGNNQGK